MAKENLESKVQGAEDGPSASLRASDEGLKIKDKSRKIKVVNRSLMYGVEFRRSV
jgi:hypothetical protein